jgi:hypothetical protein
MNDGQTKRKIFILASAIDTALSGIVLLIYFGFLPVDISSWGISHGVLGLVGGIWFIISIGILAYQLTKTDIAK